MSFQLPAIRQLCRDSCQRAPDATSLPQEQGAKINMVSVVRILVFSIMHS